MFRTFYKADITLIETAQWAVRQVELHTQVERRDILTFLTLTTKWLLIANFLVNLTLLLLEANLIFPSLINLVQIFFIFGTYREHKNLILCTPKPGIIPIEILNRLLIRVVSILLLPFLVVGWVGLVMVVDTLTPTTLILLSNTMVLFIQLIIEYFLCTSSLPPGEKERKRQEKEMSNMSPAFNGNT